MKQIFGNVIFPLTIAASMMFAACGSDDSSSNVERDDDESSSSVTEESSSSKKVSSSSSSQESDKGVRAATLEDLEKKYYVIDKLLGTKVVLATGAKQGVFSLWIPDTAWVAIHSEFKDGVLEYSFKNASFQSHSSREAEMEAFLEKGGDIQFTVEDGVLKYSLNGAKSVAARDTSIKVENATIIKSEDLKNSKLACKAGKDSHTYTFYGDRFLEEDVEDDTTRWSAGYYDIQYNHLLLMPSFYEGSVAALTTALVKDSYAIKMVTGERYECKKSEVKYDAVEKDSVVGEWESGDWSLSLKKNGSYELRKTEEDKIVDRKGTWDVYGNLMLLNPVGIKGVVKNVKPGKSFTFESDGAVKLPKEWTAVLFDE